MSTQRCRSFNNNVHNRDVLLLNLLFLSFKLESILEQLHFSQHDFLRRGEQCGVFSQQTQEDGETGITNCTSTQIKL